jgi:hypothetical protein
VDEIEGPIDAFEYSVQRFRGEKISDHDLNAVTPPHPLQLGRIPGQAANLEAGLEKPGNETAAYVASGPGDKDLG